MSMTAYKAKWLIDGVSNSQLADAMVLVENGKIAAAGSGLAVPEGATLVDLGEVTLLPGLIDCHVHLPFDGLGDPLASFLKLAVTTATLMGLKHAQEMLHQGVTTVRDVSTPHGISIALRDAIEAGIVSGPRIIAAGTHISITGGHGSAIGIEADGPSEIRKAVRQQIKSGADFVKIMVTGGVYSLRQQPGSVQLLMDEVKAAVEVAHNAGCRVACHAEGEEGISIALEAGVDTIEHGNLLTPELAERMARDKTYLIPTALAFKTVADSPDVPEVYKVKASKMIQASYNCMKLARQAGVKVAIGSDSGTCPNLPWSGHPLVQEIELLMKAGGFSPLAAIKAATSVAAEALGVDDVVGSIEPGKVADVIAVVGNPLEDLNMLKAPILVLRGGEMVHSQEDAK